FFAITSCPAAAVLVPACSSIFTSIISQTLRRTRPFDPWRNSQEHSTTIEESRFNDLANRLLFPVSQWARRNIETNGRRRGPIPRVRHCADKQRRAGRSWF